jgi:hypothetical protein
VIRTDVKETRQMVKNKEMKYLSQYGLAVTNLGRMCRVNDSSGASDESKNQMECLNISSI